VNRRGGGKGAQSCRRCLFEERTDRAGLAEKSLHGYSLNFFGCILICRFRELRRKRYGRVQKFKSTKYVGRPGLSKNSTVKGPT
jgi:hypothetical protein